MKKLLSIIMVIVIALSCCSVAFAYDNEGYPMVYLAGFGDTNIYYEDDPEQKSLFFPLDTDRLLGNLKNMDDYIIESVKNKEPNLLYTCIYNYVWDSFGMLRLNPDGSCVDGVVAAEIKLNYVGDGRYDFNYDCRNDPFEIARQLKDYIAMVKEATGSDKIELVASSYSANAALTYLEVYKDDLSDIDSVVLCVPSIGGISLFSELLAGEINVDHRAFKDYIGNLDDSGFVYDFMDLLDEYGILEPLIEAMLIPALKAAIYDALMDICRDIVATIPAAWACVTDEYFEKAMINMFGENYDSPDHEFAPHIEKATYFHENIKMKAEEILTQTRDNNPDMHMAVVCKYGNPSIPLSKHDKTLTDGLVFIELSSFGATCADYGKTLGEDYQQAKYGETNLISPDNKIDASTCLFPFNTWFIKGLDHAQKNEDYHKVLAAVAYGDLDVYTDDEYPQYLMVSPEDAERIVPYYDYEQEETLYNKIWNVFRAIVLFPKTIWTKIFG
jgi:pimeloyl-ACP methyl ester carboxylesterase